VYEEEEVYQEEEEVHSEKLESEVVVEARLSAPCHLA
jgi:hypothetical protein